MRYLCLVFDVFDCLGTSSSAPAVPFLDPDCLAHFQLTARFS